MVLAICLRSPLTQPPPCRQTTAGNDPSPVAGRARSAFRATPPGRANSTSASDRTAGRGCWAEPDVHTYSPSPTTAAATTPTQTNRRDMIAPPCACVVVATTGPVVDCQTASGPLAPRRGPPSTLV